MATLSAGMRIGSYEVIGPLGAGGMGEVYRARDTRLEREVAIKLLPEDVAHDPERLARFEREARLLAAVHHAHVATLFGIEEHDGRRVLVMECVAGDTLAQRIARGPLPVAEAVAICRQIALGLEAAHEAGIIHRDLKPANVMITPDGDAKVLDFGLARGGMASGTSTTDLTHSPTMSVMGTAAGVILGTAAYMSPEQARGRPVDRRTDVWAFGCVLYECLTGRQAFSGETISDIVARILEREPDWTSLPASVSPELREVLAHCLAKDPRARTRDIGDARLAMERALTAPVARPKAAAFPWPAVAAALVIGAAGTWLAMRLAAPPARPAISHLSIDIPRELRAAEGFGVLPGRGLLFAAQPRESSDTGTPALYLRPFDRHEAIPIEGGGGIRDGAASRDGRWLAMRVPAPGEPARSRLVRKSMRNDSPTVDLGGWDESWSSMCVLENGDVLLLTQDGSTLTRVSGAGDRAPPAKLDLGNFKGYVNLGDPLPGDRGVLIDRTGYVDQGWTHQCAVLDLRSLKIRVLVARGGSPAYDGHGHLVFARAAQLLAVPFDPDRMETRGEPVAVMDGVRVEDDLLRTEFALDAEGNLYFRRGGVLTSQRHLGLVDASGAYRRLPIEARNYHYWLVGSADGSRFISRVLNSEMIDEAWVGEVSPPSLRRRIAMQSADVVGPMISPDGNRLAYSRLGRDSLDGVYVADVDGNGLGTRILPVDSVGARMVVTSWSPDQRLLFFDRREGRRPADVWCLALDATGERVESLTPLLQGPADETSALFSPDGRWVMYLSDEAGRKNVYVAPFDRSALRLGRPTRLTSEASSYPTWLPDGRFIVLRPEGGAVMRAPISLSGKPALGSATRWFDPAPYLDNEILGANHAVVIEKAAGESEEFTAVDVILDWAGTLSARIESAKK